MNTEKTHGVFAFTSMSMCPYSSEWYLVQRLSWEGLHRDDHTGTSPV